jgi:hypothetical protein
VQEVVYGFWPLTTDVADDSNYANNLTNVGVTFEGWGIFGGASRAYRTNAAEVGLDATAEWGIGGRVKNISGAGLASAGLVGKTDSYGNPTNGYGCYLESDGEPPNYVLTFFLVLNGTKYSVIRAQAWTPSVVYSWAIRKSRAGGFLKLYVNGVLRGTAWPGSIDVDANDDEFAIGQWANSEYLDAFMQELWVVQECPTEAQILDIHTDGFESVYGGLTAELTEEVTASDGLSILVARTVNDNQVVLDDVDAQLVGLHYTKNENQIALDAVSFSLSKAFTDTAVASEVTGFGRFQSAEEEVTAADVLSSQTLKRAFEEMGATADELLGAGWARALADEVQSADARACEVSLFLTEGAAASDGLESTLITGLLYGAEEQFAASDLPAFAMGVVRTEQAEASDAFAVLAAPTYGEFLVTTDAGARQAGPLYAELISATEGLALSAAATRVDTGALADALALTIGASPPGEAVEAADIVSLEPQLAVAEQATLADLLDLLYTRGGFYAEELVSADALAILVQPEFPEGLAAGELLTVAVGLRVAEELSAAEGMQVEAELHVAEAVAVADAVRPVLNPLVVGQVGTVEFENATRNFWWEDVS